MYLGMPLLHVRIGKHNFEFFLEKVHRKLNGWDVKKLSLVGRITLAKSILLAIPNHFTGMIHLLVSTYQKIEKLTRNFIWGSSWVDRKPTLLSWKDCCRPIEKRGLGLQKLVDQNKVFLLKLGYQLLSNKEAFWVHILRKKYRMDDLLSESITQSNCFSIWISLSNVWPEVLKKVIWAIRDSSIVNFWNDIWLSLSRTLKEFYYGMDQIDETL